MDRRHLLRGEGQILWFLPLARPRICPWVLVTWPRSLTAGGIMLATAKGPLALPKNRETRTRRKTGLEGFEETLCEETLSWAAPALGWEGGMRVSVLNELRV